MLVSKEKIQNNKNYIIDNIKSFDHKTVMNLSINSNEQYNQKACRTGK